MKTILLEELMIDVGAGTKDEYIEMLRIRQGLKIHAIEPHPEIAEELRARFANNPRVIVHELACVESAPKHRAKFWLCNPKSCSSTLPLVTENFRKWKYPAAAKLFQVIAESEVDALSLSGFVDANLKAFKQINHLNIDVQGDTLSVLKGMSADHLSRVSEITTKVHSIDWELYTGQSKIDDVVQYLVQRGFKQTQLTTTSRGQEVLITFVRVNPIKIGPPLNVQQKQVKSRQQLDTATIDKSKETIGAGINVSRIRKR